MFRNPFVRRLAVAGTLAVVTTLAFHSSATSASPGAAVRFHLELLSSEPAVNATVTESPKQLKLWFSESIEFKGTSVQLTNTRGEAVKLGTLSVDTAPLAPAIVVVPQALGAGKYTVAWRAAGDDGHPSTGKFSFVVK